MPLSEATEWGRPRLRGGRERFSRLPSPGWSLRLRGSESRHPFQPPPSPRCCREVDKLPSEDTSDASAPNCFGVVGPKRDSSGDWTPLELLFGGSQGLPATILALLCQGAKGRDAETCAFHAMVRQPAHSAFTYVALFRDLRLPSCTLIPIR